MSRFAGLKRRLTGAALIVPLAVALPVMVQSCQRGVVVNSSHELRNNLMVVLFLVGVPAALVGLSLLFGKKKR